MMNDLNENGNRFKNSIKLGHVASIFEGETTASFEMCQEDQKFMDILNNNMSLSILDLSKKLIDYANEELI
jgi:hypothetical protein